ncbi:MAG: Crp/Fnr family transcriptional regulator [Alphaproteobacteria bacterium]
MSGGHDVDRLIALRQHTRAFLKKGMLFRQGDSWDGLYILHSGWAFNYRLTGEGRRQIFHIFLPGDVVNLSALRLERAPDTVQALTDVVVCVFPRVEMDSYMHDDIRRTHFLERQWLDAVWSAKESIADLGRRTSAQRIARFILGIERRLRERDFVSDGKFAFPLRYQHIADTLGLTPVHVNRIFTDLRTQGIIDLQGRTLSILRPEALASLVS